MKYKKICERLTKRQKIFDDDSDKRGKKRPGSFNRKKC